MSREYDLAIIGAGNMAEAIVRGAIAADVFAPRHALAADPSPDRRAVFEGLGLATTADSVEAAAAAERVLLAVKPQTLDKLEGAMRRIDGRKQCVVSIMAGVRIATLSGAIRGGPGGGEGVGGSARVVRIMPNTPLLAGAGMSAVAAGAGASGEDVRFADRLVAGAGAVVHVEEAMMDAVTAVSGSGPAYVFYLAEAMEAAAGELGLDGATAATLVSQTLVGAAALLRDSPDGAATLRRKVTSPGGTTEAAINHLERHDAAATVRRAIQAAAERSRELGG